MLKQYAVRCKGCGRIVTYLDYDKATKELMKSVYKGMYCHCGYNFEFGRVEGTEKDGRTGNILNGEFKPMRW